MLHINLVGGEKMCGHILSLSEAGRRYMEDMVLFSLVFCMFEVLHNIRKTGEWIYKVMYFFNSYII